MKKFICAVMVFILVISVLFTSAYAEDSYNSIFSDSETLQTKEYKQKFWDVEKSHWAFNAISELTERGAINGYTDGSFKPDKTVTRAEWAKIMVLAAGLSTNDNSVRFTDMSGHWATPYVNAAKDYLTAFKDNSYRPEQDATREDVTMAMVILKGYSTSDVDYSVLSKFTDVASISNNLKVYVAIGVEKGLITGFEDDTFRGQATLTRAQAATILWRAFQFGNDNKTVAVVDSPIITEKGIDNKTDNVYIYQSENDIENKIEDSIIEDSIKRETEQDVPEEESQEEVTEIEEKPEEKKPFLLNSLVKGITVVTGMIPANNKFVFATNEDVRTVDLEGNVEVLCPLPKFKGETIKDYKLVYNHFSNEIFMVGQIKNADGYPTYDAAVYLLNGENAELLDSNSEVFLNIMYAPPIFIDRDTMILAVNNMDGGGLIFWDGKFTKSEDVVWIYGLMYYKDSLYSINGKEISEYSFSSDSFEIIADTDLPNTGEYNKNWTYQNVLAVEDSFYYNNGDSIYKVDINGNGELYFNEDEIEVLDRKPIKKIYYLSPLDNVIAFYDPDNNSIRAIMENDR